MASVRMDPRQVSKCESQKGTVIRSGPFGCHSLQYLILLQVILSWPVLTHPIGVFDDYGNIIMGPEILWAACFFF